MGIYKNGKCYSGKTVIYSASTPDYTNLTAITVANNGTYVPQKNGYLLIDVEGAGKGFSIYCDTQLIFTIYIPDTGNRTFLMPITSNLTYRFELNCTVNFAKFVPAGKGQQIPQNNGITQGQLNTALAGKQDTGDYVTDTQLNTALTGYVTRDKLDDLPTGGGGGISVTQRVYESVTANTLKQIPIKSNKSFVEILKFEERPGTSTVVVNTLTNANADDFNTTDNIEFTPTGAKLINIRTLESTLIDGVQAINLTTLNDSYSNWIMGV